MSGFLRISQFLERILIEYMYVDSKYSCNLDLFSISYALSKIKTQGCSANSYNFGNSFEFLEKSYNLLFAIFSTFFIDNQHLK